jgi:hypothetical protein
MTMRCDECAHWRKDSDNQQWEPSRAGFGECVGVRERWRIMDEASEGLAWGSGEEGLDPYSDELPAESFTMVRIAALKAARAYVQDGSEYHAELFTAPDFFCALWAAQGIVSREGEDAAAASVSEAN